MLPGPKILSIPVNSVRLPTPNSICSSQLPPNTTPPHHTTATLSPPPHASTPRQPERIHPSAGTRPPRARSCGDRCERGRSAHRESTLAPARLTVFSLFSLFSPWQSPFPVLCPLSLTLCLLRSVVIGAVTGSAASDLALERLGLPCGIPNLPLLASPPLPLCCVNQFVDELFCLC